MWPTATTTASSASRAAGAFLARGAARAPATGSSGSLRRGGGAGRHRLRGRHAQPPHPALQRGRRLPGHVGQLQAAATDSSAAPPVWRSADGTVYVADRTNHRIQRFSATGTFLGKWGSQGDGDGQFKSPSGVAVGPDGTVYVADTGNHRIQRFTSTTAPSWARGAIQAAATGSSVNPHGVAVAAGRHGLRGRHEQPPHPALHGDRRLPG